MNIVYCIPHLYNAGGMERVLTQKVNWLAAHTPHMLTVVTTEKTPADQPSVRFALDSRVKVVPLSIGFDEDYRKPLPLKWIGHMRRMRAYRQVLTRYIRLHHVDLCISMGGKEIAFLRHLPCRTIAELHFVMEHRQLRIEALHGGRLWKQIGRIRTLQLVRAVRPLERLVVLTEADRQQWMKAGCTNVVCIPNPCSLDGEKTPISTKKEKRVLAVGRLHREKGFDLLLQAWGRIEKAIPDYRLWIIGEGPQRDDLGHLIERMGLHHVVLSGTTTEIAKEYAKASCFVLSSRYEGFSLALSEAMWSGLPCVAFDCPYGPRELIGDTRGWLVKAGDVEELAQQIVYVTAHPEEAAERAHAAQAFARAQYGEEHVMEQLRSEYGL